MSWHLVSHKKAIFQLFFPPPPPSPPANLRLNKSDNTNRDQILCGTRISISVAQNMQIQQSGKELHCMMFAFKQRNVSYMIKIDDIRNQYRDSRKISHKRTIQEIPPSEFNSLMIHLGFIENILFYSILGFNLHTHCSDLQVKWRSQTKQFYVSLGFYFLQ